MKDSKRLLRLLTVNYEALGFKVSNFEDIANATPLPVIRFMIHCPCGGTEYGSFAYDPGCDTDLTEEYARAILQHSASRFHLRSDIEKGILPADFDVEKHSFKQLILVD